VVESLESPADDFRTAVKPTPEGSDLRAALGGKLSKALDSAVLILRQHRGEVHDLRALEPLAAIATEFAATDALLVRVSDLALSVALCHPAGEKILRDALEAKGGPPPLPMVGTAMEGSRCGGADALVLDHAEVLWRETSGDAKALESFRGIVASAISGLDRGLLQDADPAAAADRVSKAAAKALERAPDAAFAKEIALALAKSPAGPPRRVLTGWLTSRKGIPADTLLAVIGALGDAGDPEAVPPLLAEIPGTPGKVFKAAYDAIRRCSEEALKAKVKEILDTLIPVIREDLRTYAAIKESNRKEVPLLLDRAQSIAGHLGTPEHFHSVLWKVVDANQDLFARAPPPPPRSGLKRALAGSSPVVDIEDWFEWWKTARSFARR
jgi:hypothetical protein